MDYWFHRCLLSWIQAIWFLAREPWANRSIASTDLCLLLWIYTLCRCEAYTKAFGTVMLYKSGKIRYI